MMALNVRSSMVIPPKQFHHMLLIQGGKNLIFEWWLIVTIQVTRQLEVHELVF